MINQMRDSTLQTLGLGSMIEIFQKGKLPASANELVDQVFGEAGNRGALVISGANGIVGAGKTMQLGTRLGSYGIPIIHTKNQKETAELIRVISLREQKPNIRGFTT